MLRIRLTRVGRRNRPFWRMVVAEARRARDGRCVEILGQYQPLFNPPIIKIDEERALYWLNNGAQPSDSCRSILSKLGVMKKFSDAKMDARKARKAAKQADAGKAPAAPPAPPAAPQG